MNYYMPFTNLGPAATRAATTGGLLSRIFRNGINWGAILSNTQKTLNIINQTIPVIKQVRPVMNNAKTMFKIMNEFKKVDTPNEVQEKTQKTTTENDKITDTKHETKAKNEKPLQYNSNSNPVFFI